MGSCCSSNDTPKKSQKGRCPSNNKEYHEVPVSTIIHHISKPWDWDGHSEHFFFCDDPSCDVIYFSDSGRIIKQEEIRTPVGQKDKSANATLCYCFGVTRLDYINNEGTKDFVVNQTRNKTCACDSRNPSGRCCLKDFKRDGIS